MVNYNKIFHGLRADVITCNKQLTSKVTDRPSALRQSQLFPANYAEHGLTSRRLVSLLKHYANVHY